jgi:hypothetical protein
MKLIKTKKDNSYWYIWIFAEEKIVFVSDFSLLKKKPETTVKIYV